MAIWSDGKRTERFFSIKEFSLQKINGKNSWIKGGGFFCREEQRIVLVFAACPSETLPLFMRHPPPLPSE
jgi:hypothetical protein